MLPEKQRTKTLKEFAQFLSLYAIKRLFQRDSSAVLSQPEQKLKTDNTRAQQKRKFSNYIMLRLHYGVTAYPGIRGGSGTGFQINERASLVVYTTLIG